MNAHVEASLAAVLDRKMALRGKVFYEPTSVEVVGKRLDAFLAEQLSEPFEVRGLRLLTGGASMEQYVFRLDRPGQPEPATDMILRMSPLCSVIESSRVRELEILRAVEGVLPAPRAFWLAPDDRHFGRPALISSFDPGVTAPTAGVAKATGLATAYGPLRSLLGPQFVAHLAALHTLDWSRADLPSLEVPRAGTTDSVDWRIALWDRVWSEDTFEAHPVVALTSEWLWEHRPPVDQVSLLHGDYRNGNFLFDESDGRITAILDWEAGHLGDRHMDLAYAMLPGYGHLDEEDGAYLCAGLIRKDELLESYARSSGLSVDPERLHYYTVLNMYWAVIACYATASRLAAERMTHLDTMMNFVTGLAAFFVGELTTILEEDLR